MAPFGSWLGQRKFVIRRAAPALVGGTQSSTAISPVPAGPLKKPLPCTSVGSKKLQANVAPSPVGGGAARPITPPPSGRRIVFTLVTALVPPRQSFAVAFASLSRPFELRPLSERFGS